MKLLYAARIARFELLRAISSLAWRIARWSKECDSRLYRLMCYVFSTYSKKMRAHIGNPMANCCICAFSDADLAGEHGNSKSTAGALVAIVGPQTFVPLSAISKKQTAASHRTTQAETISAEMSLRTEGLSMMTLWEHAHCTGHGGNHRCGSLKIIKPH